MMPRRLDVDVLDPEQTKVVLGQLLESYVMPSSIERDTVYSRIHDDHDGDAMQALEVMVMSDGDVAISIGKRQELRFRTDTGGGCSPRVRNALLALAEAIRRDNEDAPQEDIRKAWASKL